MFEIDPIERNPLNHLISANAHIGALPDAVFSRIVDVAALPDWNDAITEVVESPAELSAGAVWKVRLQAFGSRVSRSEVVDLDRAKHHFAYRSQSDDGNPSFADWSWRVTSDGEGSRVEVSVDPHQVTFFRKYLMIHVRKPTLRKQMQASLVKLGENVMGEATSSKR